MPQAGKKLSIPFSSPFTQAVQSNMVYPPREVSMVSTNITARRINADRYRCALTTKAARLALQMPDINQEALESAQGFMARVARIDVGLCPVCKVGHLRTVEVLSGAKQLPTPGAMVWPQERGPP
jgi:hypothetical protein